MDTNQTNEAQKTVGETLDTTQAAEIGGGGCVLENSGLLVTAYEDAIAFAVHVAERVTGQNQ